MARKGQFRKGGGRHGHAKTRTRTITKTKYRTRGAKKHHRSRRRHHGRHGGISIAKLAIAGAGLAYLTGAKSPVQSIPTNIAKIPGAKTFGNAATAGLILLGVDRFVKRNPWIRAAGLVGVVLGAAQVGTQGSDFKWLGDGSDVGDEYTGDIDGDDDIGDMDGADQD